MHDWHTGITHAAAAKDPMANTKDATPNLYIHAFRILAHSPNALLFIRFHHQALYVGNSAVNGLLFRWLVVQGSLREDSAANAAEAEVNLCR